MKGKDNLTWCYTAYTLHTNIESGNMTPMNNIPMGHFLIQKIEIFQL